MSQNYYIDDQTPTYPPPSQSSNTMGLVGFIFSLASLATCGLLSPIAFFISLIGMFRAPRGFAVAGAAISGVTIVAVAGMGFAIFQAGKAGFDQAQLTAQRLHTMDILRDASEEIELYYEEQGEYPSGVEGNKLILSLKDAWGNALLYERLEDEDGYDIRSDGPDGISGTDDDLTYDPWDDFSEF